MRLEDLHFDLRIGQNIITVCVLFSVHKIQLSVPQNLFQIITKKKSVTTSRKSSKTYENTIHNNKEVEHFQDVSACSTPHKDSFCK